MRDVRAPHLVGRAKARPNGYPAFLCETSIELNFAVLKFKHTVKKKKS